MKKKNYLTYEEWAETLPISTQEAINKAQSYYQFWLTSGSIESTHMMRCNAIEARRFLELVYDRYREYVWSVRKEMYEDAIYRQSTV